MWAKLHPNYRCPDDFKGSKPCSGTEEYCKSLCYCGVWWCDTHEEDCLAGPGKCYYQCFTTYLENVAPNSWICWCFWTLIEDTCEQDPGSPMLHADDIPRTVLFDYNLSGMEPAFMESWKLEDQKVVIRFTNKPTRMNVKVLVDVEAFLPGQEIFF